MHILHSRLVASVGDWWSGASGNEAMMSDLWSNDVLTAASGGSVICVEIPTLEQDQGGWMLAVMRCCLLASYWC